MHLDGQSNREIASVLHMSKDTINKYVREYEEQKQAILEQKPDQDSEELIQALIEKPKYNVRNRKHPKASPKVIKIINECLQLNEEKRATGRSKQQMSKKDIHEYVISKGIDLSYSTVKRVVDSERKRHYEAFIKQEYLPGEICEFDWGTTKLNINNTGYLPYQMAVFTAPYSNYRCAFIFKAQDTSAFQEAHARFFSFCKGNYQTMVYDNMRVAVKKFVGLHEKEPTDALLELSLYYGFHFRFCNIARGNEKGHVERSVEYIRRKAFGRPGMDCFDRLEAVNGYLLQACQRMNAEKGSNKSTSYERFQIEKSHLRANLTPFESCIYSEHRVDKYSTVTISQNHYSVQDIYVGKIINAKLYTSKIKLYHDNTLITIHSRTFGFQDWNIDIYHYLRTLKRKPGALRQSTALLQTDTRIKNIYERYYSSNPKGFLEVLEIMKEKGIVPVEKAVEQLAAMTPLDLSVDKIKFLLSQKDDILPGRDAVSIKAEEVLVLYDELAFAKNKNQGEEIRCS